MEEQFRFDYRTRILLPLYLATVGKEDASSMTLERRTSFDRSLHRQQSAPSEFFSLHVVVFSAFYEGGGGRERGG